MHHTSQMMTMKQQMPRPQAELLAENDTGKRYKVVSQSLPEQREFSTAESNPDTAEDSCRQSAADHNAATDHNVGFQTRSER